MYKTLIFILLYAVFLSPTYSQQQWGVKKDTLYYNDFDKETRTFFNDTLLNESDVLVKKYYNDNSYVITNFSKKDYLGSLLYADVIGDYNKVEITIDGLSSRGSSLRIGSLEIKLLKGGLKFIDHVNTGRISMYSYKGSKYIFNLVCKYTNDDNLLIWVNEDFVNNFNNNINQKSISYTVPKGNKLVLKKIKIGSKLNKEIIYNFANKYNEFKENNQVLFKGVVRHISSGQLRYFNNSEKKIVEKLYSLNLKNETLNLSIEGISKNFKIDFGIYELYQENNYILLINRLDSNSFLINKSFNGNINNILFSISKSQGTIKLGNYSYSFNWTGSFVNFLITIPPQKLITIDRVVLFSNKPRTLNEYVAYYGLKNYRYWQLKENEKINSLEKGPFEKTVEFKKRVENAREHKSKYEFEKNIIDSIGLTMLNCKATKWEYDADKELMTLHWPNLNLMYSYIPPHQANAFATNLCMYNWRDFHFVLKNNDLHFEQGTIEVDNNLYTFTYLQNSNLVSSRSGNDYANEKEIIKTVPMVLKKRTYYLFVIANQDYKDGRINDLTNPIKDAEALINVLSLNYNFDEENIIFLKNATRAEIIKNFDKLALKVSPEDNLLIYYAGHGIWDQKIKKGYWLPIDARQDNRVNWFSNSNLKDYIAGINTKHTLLISDACFSGSIFKTRNAFDDNLAIAELYNLTSRQAMTSGTFETVPDRSFFNYYLVKRLKDNVKKMLPVQELFNSFRVAVINNSPTSQVPQFGDIRESGDEGGEFIFIKR